ncbi:hypothetical protein YC2023_053759 [Brassica napus]
MVPQAVVGSSLFSFPLCSIGFLLLFAVFVEALDCFAASSLCSIRGRSERFGVGGAISGPVDGLGFMGGWCPRVFVGDPSGGSVGTKAVVRKVLEPGRFSFPSVQIVGVSPNFSRT